MQYERKHSQTSKRVVSASILPLLFCALFLNSSGTLIGATVVPNIAPATPTASLTETELSSNFSEVNVAGCGQLFVPNIPKNFDPLSAPASELAAYGYPTPPNDVTSSQYQEWHDAMSALKPPSNTGPCKAFPDIRLSTSASDNWSGHVVDSQEYLGGAAIWYAQSEFHWPQPSCTVAPPYRIVTSCDKSSYGASVMAMWVGLGGYETNTGLTQIGVYQQGIAADSGGTGYFDGQANFVWQQISSSNQSTSAFGFGPIVNPGDTIFVSVRWDFGLGPKVVSFFAEDVTTGYNRQFTKNVPYLVSATSADYIYECPTVSFEAAVNGRCATGLLGPGQDLYRNELPVVFDANQYEGSYGQFPVTRALNDNIFEIATGCPYQNMTTTSAVNDVTGGFTVVPSHLTGQCPQV